MKVLVVGGGGREHALCWALKRSPNTRLVCAPGSDAIARLAERRAVGVHEIDKLAELCDSEKPDLVVVGPEAPLAAGLSDALAARGHLVFGPSRQAAAIECSKAFAKTFMAKHRIPTARFETFSDLGDAEWFIDELFEKEKAAKVVLKASGLASGKGVLICEQSQEAKAHARAMLEGSVLGGAGKTLVIEEFLRGREATLMALCDGERVLPLAACEDHKTIFDGDRGPMTGGMGVISPTPALDDATCRRVYETILLPTVRGLGAEGKPFRGLLYAGLMITADGPQVIEFNCRFGDPEIQALVRRLDDDLVELLHASARGELPSSVRFSDQTSVCVVMTAPGYPGETTTGQAITGLDEASSLKSVEIFHAGTRFDGKSWRTHSGRVLGVTAVGKNLDEARQRTYAAVEKIHFDGAHYRHDIGGRAV